MNENFRRRVFTPIVMPLTLVGAVLLFALSLARVLLAVPESISVVIVVVLAAYVLLMAFVVEQQRSITAPAVAVGLVLGFLGVVGAGAVAASVGIREIHHGDEEGEVAAEAVAEVPEDALLWGADAGLAYTTSPDSAPAGTVTLALENESAVPHNVVFEGFQSDQVLVENAGGIDVTTVDVPAGTYTYYCSIAGHRAAGMEGEIVFE